MKKNPYYSINKTERAINLLCYYGVGAVVVPYIDLKHVSWNEEIRMEFTTVTIVFTPPVDFDVQEFLEYVREQWIFEIKDEGDFFSEVYINKERIGYAHDELS